MTRVFEGRVQTASLRRVEEAITSQPRRLFTALKPAFQRWGAAWEQRMDNHLRGGGPDFLSSRSGHLRRHTKSKISGGTLAKLALKNEIAGVIYARIQEHGGEIRAKAGKFLTIPTGPNKTAAGVVRFPSARSFISSHQGETFFVTTKGGTLLLMWKKPSAAVRKSAGKRKGQAVAMFVLKEKVELPGPLAPTKKTKSRLGFFDSWREGAGERAIDLARVARELGTR